MTRSVRSKVSSWLTTRQTANRLRVSPSRVHALLTQGRLHAIQTPLGHLIDPASVAAYDRQRAAWAAQRGREK
jgi:hypothetical protein